ncbi:WecB/TagA/CpsF family glycosyltransferase [Changchengzhania lutea]|uniref:WecB/TagA/CpsF family glycosyltransferase n=1 Tax=Changchengzhania lutea TaxID=2049305 RepID=UPI00115DF5DB|nr:WecB/TagA/CpsF family glycosyltransferase [Changchengzhania lutea]
MNTKKKYFNIKIEFDSKRVDSIIQETIVTNKKGYVCSVESNNLTVANRDEKFLKVLNSALVNICDGSILAKILGFIHKKPFKSYIGADLFIKYVNMCKYRQYFLGNTQEVLDGLKNNLSKIDPKINSMIFQELPFRKVEEFDYRGIAEKINKDKPDIIWVSLGAPKQEIFMSMLLPYLEKGVMFGFGAIFNFNSSVGSVNRAPKLFLNLKLEWLYRAFEEPKKNIPRYWSFVKLLPFLIKNEKN